MPTILPSPPRSWFGYEARHERCQLIDDTRQEPYKRVVFRLRERVALKFAAKVAEPREHQPLRDSLFETFEIITIVLNTHPRGTPRSLQ